MKCFLIFLILIIFSYNCSGLIITEFELNPPGSDSGNEWIEFFSEDEIDLEGYKIINNDGDEKNLEGIFSGYFIYKLEGQWLDNSDEKIFLYKNNELIFETDLTYDSKNNDKTLQYCDYWFLGDSTKGEKNDCWDEVESEEDEKEDEDNEKYPKKEIDENLTITKEENIVENNPVILSPKTIKKENHMDKYAIYSFVVFCVLLGFLFWAKRKNTNYKNEFENE